MDRMKFDWFLGKVVSEFASHADNNHNVRYCNYQICEAYKKHWHSNDSSSINYCFKIIFVSDKEIWTYMEKNSLWKKTYDIGLRRNPMHCFTGCWSHSLLTKVYDGLNSPFIESKSIYVFSNIKNNRIKLSSQ